MKLRICTMVVLAAASCTQTVTEQQAADPAPDLSAPAAQDIDAVLQQLLEAQAEEALYGRPRYQIRPPLRVTDGGLDEQLQAQLRAQAEEIMAELRLRAESDPPRR